VEAESFAAQDVACELCDPLGDQPRPCYGSIGNAWFRSLHHHLCHGEQGFRRLVCPLLKTPLFGEVAGDGHRADLVSVLIA